MLFVGEKVGVVVGAIEGVVVGDIEDVVVGVVVCVGSMLESVCCSECVVGSGSEGIEVCFSVL